MGKELTDKVIEEIAKKNSEPLWMKEKRLESLHIFKEMPMPTGQEETWRRTDFSTFRIIETIPYIEPLLQVKEYDNLNNRGKFSSLSDRNICGTLVQQNSHTVFNKLARDLHKRGVIYTDIISAIHIYPDLIKTYLLTDCIKPDDSKFTAIHAACLNGGTFLYIPKGVEVYLPIRSLFSMNTNGGGMFYHTLIIAGAYSKVTYVEEYSSPFIDTQTISNSAVEIFLNESASVNYVGLQNWATDVYHFITKRAIVNKDAS
ncbi:MAG: FeS cluster assembly protein SufB [Candidatus Scalindua rubra]|uniref:FeS cluster assembly protein SufB n=1 Tax=Candidatus Scalindua rubra TaxID=1872076 RepID=A0A1E3X3J4_9BACT|nr:MAG: FeS cluster assembly protein SufB [Candidatus Scalindua rubra]